MNDIAQWVERVQKTGDVEAFSQLVARFEGMAFAIAMHRLHDVAASEDACQDAFLATYLQIGGLRTPEAFPGWFRQVVYKHADRIGRKVRPTAALHHVSEPMEPFDEAGSARHEMQSVRAALMALPERTRLITELYYSGEHSISQVAVFFEVSDTLVKKTLYQARRLLRQEVLPMDVHDSVSQLDASMLQERVTFFLHLRGSNEPEVTRLLTKHPVWVNAQDLPDAEPARWYMPSMGRSTPFCGWWSLVTHQCVRFCSNMARTPI